jgi:hypothetical protein
MSKTGFYCGSDIDIRATVEEEGKYKQKDRQTYRSFHIDHSLLYSFLQELYTIW